MTNEKGDELANHFFLSLLFIMLYTKSFTQFFYIIDFLLFSTQKHKKRTKKMSKILESAKSFKGFWHPINKDWCKLSLFDACLLHEKLSDDLKFLKNKPIVSIEQYEKIQSFEFAVDELEDFIILTGARECETELFNPLSSDLHSLDEVGAKIDLFLLNSF